jgi:hypothetical protein
VIQNNTKHRQVIEMIVPNTAFSWLKISPTVISLEPHGTARVEIDFFPPQEIFEEEDPIAWHEKKLLSEGQGKGKGPGKGQE